MSFTPAFMLSQLFTILLSRQRVNEFEIEHDLADGQVLVTWPRNLTTNKDF